ncbi:MAG: hypothetical protein HKM24_07700, partial [Gammaproteobacteria bacterium]|nr:hypothetical protein [Gammaproteobacteria bacterium]
MRKADKTMMHHTAAGSWPLMMTWQQKVLFVVAFAAGPILMVSSSVFEAAAFGLFIGFCLLISQVIISLIKIDTHSPLRWLIYLTVIATVALVAERWLAIYFFEILQNSGAIWALGGAQLLILAHSDWVATRQPLLKVVASSLMIALILLAFIVIMAALR